MNASESPHEEITLGLVRAVRGMRWGDMPGETREVAPLAAEDHTYIDPMAELQAMMRPDAQIIAIEVPRDDGDAS